MPNIVYLACYREILIDCLIEYHIIYAFLEPFTVYNVTVAARTSVGYGEAVEISCNTATDSKSVQRQL